MAELLELEVSQSQFAAECCSVRRARDAKIRNSGEVRIGTSCSSHDGAGRVWWAAGATSTEILRKVSLEFEGQKVQI